MTSSNSASAPLTPAPTAVPVLDDEDDDDDDEEALVVDRELDAETGPAIVTVAVTVTGVVSVLLGDVEPDVRLKITSPALMKNDAVLPLVGFEHDLLFAKPAPQQNNGWFWMSLMRCMGAPPPGLSIILKSASRSSHSESVC